jgi:hypothetical protein
MAKDSGQAPATFSPLYGFSTLQDASRYDLSRCGTLKNLVRM